MRIKICLSFLCWLMLFKTSVNAQVSIITINVQPFNVVPEALLNANIMNGENEQQVELLTQLFNSNNVLVMSVRSQPFKLMQGLNSGLSGMRRPAATEYGSNSQAQYLKNTHNLPSGRYKICCSLFPLSGADKLDDLCDEIEADFNQYLYLVHPLDGDTVENKNPLLSWTHSEAFTILNQGEFYRMIVSEIKDGQSNEEAITVNSPAMVKNYVMEHQVQYPFDAKELKPGGKYAWQVQKIGDGVVINKTEAWKFIVRKNPEDVVLKYVALKKQPDGAYYTATDGRVYFKFSEEYTTTGGLQFILKDVKLKPLSVEILKDKATDHKNKVTTDDAKLKQMGDNRFNLDLNSLPSGYYTLEVKNEKRETFYLKILLP